MARTSGNFSNYHYNGWLKIHHTLPKRSVALELIIFWIEVNQLYHICLQIMGLGTSKLQQGGIIFMTVCLFVCFSALFFIC